MLLSTSVRRSLLRSNRICSLSHPSLRLPTAFRICIRNATSGSKVTAATSKGSSKAPPVQKFLYPERLCVYHAGTGRTTFLACLKVSTLFIFAFFGFVATPRYLDAEGLSKTTACTALAAVVPLVFVAYTTSPFVTFIHMRLPPYARQSQDMLRQFLRTLPPHAELQVTTMSPIAKPRVTTVRVADLRPMSRRLSIVNFTRDTSVENAGRRWYNFRAVGSFSIQTNRARFPWVWDEISRTIGMQKVAS